jgi:hypothetical protein
MKSQEKDNFSLFLIDNKKINYANNILMYTYFVEYLKQAIPHIIISNFQVYNISLLTVVTMMYLRSLKLIPPV